MSWAVAPSLVAMRYELDRLFPRRSTASDGTIGDPDHQARKSAHNPGARNLVHARDVTHDPTAGVDCHQLVAALVFGRDPRIRLVIFNATIWRSYHRPKTASRSFLDAWTPEPYTGPNPHRTHAHFEIHETIDAETDMSPWWEVAPPPSASTANPLELLMAVFKNDGDAEVWFVRHAYLTLLLREPESEASVLWWVEAMRANGADFMWSQIADSPEGQGVRDAQRAHLALGD